MSYTIIRRLNDARHPQVPSHEHPESLIMSHDLLDSAALSLHLEVHVASAHDDLAAGHRS